jgi:hypothetical protein
MGKGSSMEIIDFFPRACAECDHRTVTCGSGSFVERFAHPECELVGAAFNVRSRIRTPTGRRSIPLWITGVTALQTKRGECRIVEASSACKVVGAKADISKHGALSVASAWYLQVTNRKTLAKIARQCAPPQTRRCHGLDDRLSHPDYRDRKPRGWNALPLA